MIMNNQTTIWRRWSGMIFWSIVVLTVFGWLAGVADFFASALGLTDWALSYIAAFGSESDREMLSMLDTFENVATSLQFICLAAWVVYLIGLRNFREPQTSESAVEGVKSVYSACWVGIVSVALSFVGGLLPGGFRWVFTVPAWIMLLVSYIMFRSAFRGLKTESTWAERARSGAGLLRKSANYNVRLMLFPLFGLIVGAVSLFIVAAVLHSGSSDPRNALKVVLTVGAIEGVAVAVVLLWLSIMQFVYRLMGWYRIWKGTPADAIGLTTVSPQQQPETATAGNGRKRAAVIGGCVGGAALIIALIAIFSKEGAGANDDGTQLTDSVYVYNGIEIPGQLFRGADGADYYIAVLPSDAEMTWNEAVALEKDGWVLPKSMGHFSRRGIHSEMNEGKMEYRTPDTESSDPVIERMVGQPRLLTSKIGISKFPEIVGSGEYWTGTALNEANAVYISLRPFYGEMQMSSIVDTGDAKTANKHAFVVKRIPSESSLYSNPANGRREQSVNINGFEIVDPSGGLSLAYDADKITDYETDGWHIPSLGELSAIFSAALPQKGTIEIEGTPDMRRMFPSTSGLVWTAYCARDAHGRPVSFKVNNFVDDNRMRITIGSPERMAGTRVRLVRAGDCEAAAPVEETIATANDAEMMGLKGPVERVENWFEFSEEPNLVMTFDADGSLIVPAGITAVRDDLGRLTKYADERNPDSEDSFTYELTYDGDGLRPVSWTSANIGSFSTTKLTFSADGDLTTASETANLEGDEYEYFKTTTYTILARDTQGNWTKRQADVDESFGGAEPSDHVCRTYVETRKLTYRK